MHKNKTFLLKIILIIIVMLSGGIIARIRILCIRSLYKRRMLCFSVTGTEGETGAVVDVVVDVVAGVVAVAGAAVDVVAGAASDKHTVSVPEDFLAEHSFIFESPMPDWLFLI